MNINKRRNILKGLTLSVPVVWAKPVIEAVILPAHAQISVGVATIATFAGPFSTDPGAGNGIEIITDTLDASVSVGSTSSPDQILFIDTDPEDPLPNIEFALGEGDNWVEQPTEVDVPAGTFTRELVRFSAPNAGLTYRVTFTFTATNGPAGVLTVSDIIIEGPI